MKSIDHEGSEDPRFAGWRAEFTCEECRSWTGKPPIPIAQAYPLLRARGLKDFKLSHACHFRKGSDGQVHHIPITVLETADGQTIEWYPELPEKSR